MRVVEVTAFGGPEVLEVREVSDPVPAADEVLIDVEHVEIIHLDTQLRAGWGTDFFPMRPPWVPGTGVAGTIAGSGERVVARTGNEGGYAERVAVDRAQVFAVPDGVDGAVATAALHDGVLALSQLGNVRLAKGSRVLVTGAAGALGHWFVPLAKRAGAEVIGAAGGSRKVQAVVDLGADRALDYSRADWADTVGELDVVFDGVGGEIGRRASALLRPGGVLGGYGAASGDFGGATRDDVVVHGIDEQLGDEQWLDLTRAALRLLADGVVRPVIGQRRPLAEAGLAHAAIARREIVGKSVLVVGAPPDRA